MPSPPQEPHARPIQSGEVRQAKLNTRGQFTANRALHGLDMKIPQALSAHIKRNRPSPSRITPVPIDATPFSPLADLASDLLPIAVAVGVEVADGVKSAGQESKVFDAEAVAVAFPIAVETE